MGNLLQKNSSPTLAERRKKNLTSAINASVSIFNCKNAKLHITAITDNSHRPHVIKLDELPEELRQAFHDYATRLIAERLTID